MVNISNDIAFIIKYLIILSIHPCVIFLKPSKQNSGLCKLGFRMFGNYLIIIVTMPISDAALLELFCLLSLLY